MQAETPADNAWSVTASIFTDGNRVTPKILVFSFTRPYNIIGPGLLIFYEGHGRCKNSNKTQSTR